MDSSTLVYITGFTAVIAIVCLVMLKKYFRLLDLLNSLPALPRYTTLLSQLLRRHPPLLQLLQPAMKQL